MFIEGKIVLASSAGSKNGLPRINCSKCRSTKIATLENSRNFHVLKQLKKIESFMKEYCYLFRFHSYV